MMTAHDKNHLLVRQAIVAKPDKILQKPFAPEKLVRIIEYYKRLSDIEEHTNIE
jgi:hypothetical protein